MPHPHASSAAPVFPPALPACAQTYPIPGSPMPVHYTFVPTRDEVYVPVAVRKPQGEGPFPIIVMGRGAGRGGLPHVEDQVQRLAPMQDRMLERGYAVAYVNCRNEVPGLYAGAHRVQSLPDDMSGGENRTLRLRARSGAGRSVPRDDGLFRSKA